MTARVPDELVAEGAQRILDAVRGPQPIAPPPVITGREEIALARGVAGLIGASKRDVERQLGRERRERKGRRKRRKPSRRELARRDELAAKRERRREAFLARLRARGGEGCETAPRDWTQRVWTVCRSLEHDLSGRIARNVVLGMPRTLALALRRAALEPVRGADGVWRPSRGYSSVIARSRIAFGWALYVSGVRTHKAGFARVAAGFSRGMLGALFRNPQTGEPYALSYLSASSCSSSGEGCGPLEALERAGFLARKQPPPSLRAKFPAYFGPSGYGFNTYWFAARDVGVRVAGQDVIVPRGLDVDELALERALDAVTAAERPPGPDPAA